MDIPFQGGKFTWSILKLAVAVAVVAVVVVVHKDPRVSASRGK